MRECVRWRNSREAQPELGSWPLKILVIDDHPVVLEGLTALLSTAADGLAVLRASNATDGLSVLEAQPDLDAILLDLAMPGLSGSQAIDAFRAAAPDLAIIVISALETAEQVRLALAHGARGFIPKSSRPQTVLAAIRLVLAGETYIPPTILGEVGVPQDAKLTQRQVEILGALSEGQSNKEIAAALGVAEKTVKAHVSAIFRILGVVNRTQAAAAYRAKPR